MPNWKLSHTIRGHIRGHANTLAQRAVDLARMDFPLTLEQVQANCADLNPEQLETLARLRSEGVKTIERHSEIRVAFLRAALPELKRGAVLKLDLPQPIFVGRGTRYGMGTTKFSLEDESYIVPRLDDLESEQRNQLLQWLERLIRQQRINEVVVHAVRAVIDDEGLTPTAAHLKAVWPLLTTAVNIKSGGISEREVARTWTERFRNLPYRDVQRYAPRPAFIAKWGKYLEIAGGQIVAGQMFTGGGEEGRGQVIASLEHWERLASDLTFPLS